MKIAFYKASFGGLYDFLIILATGSRYSHCELVFSDGMCASSSPRDNGVRFKKINLTTGKWDIFDLAPLNLNEDKVRQWFVAHENQQYDWIGAIGSAFRLKLLSNDKKFCSQACAYAMGLDLITTPAKLFKILMKKKMKRVN